MDFIAHGRCHHGKNGTRFFLFLPELKKIIIMIFGSICAIWYYFVKMSIVKKLAILLFSMFIVVTLTFFLMKAIPGDPFSQEKAVPQEILKAMYAHYGL